MTITIRLRMILMGAIAIVVIALAIWAIGAARSAEDAGTAREHPAAPAQRVFVDDGQTILRIDAATLARSGIVVTPLPAHDGMATTSVFATVVDTTRLTDLANAWAVGAAQVSAARARAAASKASLARTRLLYADAQNASLAQLEAAQAAYAVDEASARATQAQAATALASARQEFGPALTPGSPLVDAIVSRRSLLLQVALPMEVGAPPATLAVEGDGGVRTVARLVGVAARADPRVPGRGVYYAISGSSGLVPGMSVTAGLPTGNSVRGAMVPASAIVSWQGRNWIYRRRGDGTFTRVAISADQRDPSGNYIVHDPAPGTPIVTRGAQLLLSEELKGQAPADSDGD